MGDVATKQNEESERERAVGNIPVYGLKESHSLLILSTLV